MSNCRVEHVGAECGHDVGGGSALGSSDFFPVDSDHRPGSIGSALSRLLSDPLVDHRVKDDRVDSGCRSMDRGQRRGSAVMKVEPVSRLSVRPFGDHRHRFRTRDHRTHDRQQQLEEGVTDTAPENVKSAPSARDFERAL